VLDVYGTLVGTGLQELDQGWDHDVQEDLLLPRWQLGIGSHETHKGMDIHVEDDERRDPQSPDVTQKALDA
jgi:hypothetical protein